MGRCRLDSFAANAGVANKQDLFAKYQPTDANGDLKPLNVKTRISAQCVSHFGSFAST